MPNAKKILIKKLPKFDTDVYASLSLSDLVVFALSYLEEKEVEATSEEIVSICFRLFPQKFGLKNYPRWPDSALVIRRLNDDREKKNVKGNPADGFALTYKGKQVAKRIAKALGLVNTKKKIKLVVKSKPVALVLTKKTLRKRLRKPIQAKPVKKKSVKQTKEKATKVATPKVKNVSHAFNVTKTEVKKKLSANKKQVEVKQEALKVVKLEPVVNISKEEKIKAGKVMHLVEKSDAYRLYKKNGKQAKISEFDFRNMLFTTMESSSETLSRNVLLFKKYANIHSRNDVITFLNFCEENFVKLLKKK